MPVHNFERPKGKTETIAVDSKALRGNLLGDPSVRNVAVYLPEGYDESGEPLPLFVDLVGFTGSGFSHLAWKPFGESVPQRVDRLVAAGRMGPVVAAFPDCFTSLGGNQYVNSLATGMWEDFLVGEMLPALEDRFHVRKGAAGRAVFGKSSGGYGSIVHGMKHADTWGAVACHSGDMAFDLVYRNDFPKVLDRLAKFDRDYRKFLDHIESVEKIDGDDFHVLMTLAMAATYDPDPKGYKGIRLPVDLETCELDEERWAAWLAHDPVRMVHREDCLDNLRRLQGLYIDCGFKDQYHLHYGARRFTGTLDEAGIEYRYEEFEDDHSSVDYRMDVSLPYLYESLQR